MSDIVAPDAAALLPHKAVQDFEAKSTIYGPQKPCDRLYQVRSGRVAISNCVDGGSLSVSRIVGPLGLFGEAVIAATPDTAETALALDLTRVQSWSRAEIEEQVSHQPEIGLSLMKYFAQRCEELNVRMESVAFHKTPERVMLALIELAETLGTPVEGGRRLAPLTHQIIAGYVGTSREIVTAQLSSLRRDGLLKYSRQAIDVDVTLMRKTLAERGVQVRPAVPKVSGAS